MAARLAMDARALGASALSCLRPCLRLLACLGLLASSLRQGLAQLHADGPSALAAIASLAAIAGLLMQGSTDTIFFRPEVQLIGWFALASLVSRPRQS